MAAVGKTDIVRETTRSSAVGEEQWACLEESGVDDVIERLTLQDLDAVRWACDPELPAIVQGMTPARLARAVPSWVQRVVEGDRAASPGCDSRDYTRVLDDREANSIDAWGSVLTEERFVAPRLWPRTTAHSPLPARDGLLEHVSSFETGLDDCVVYRDFPNRPHEYMAEAGCAPSLATLGVTAQHWARWTCEVLRADQTDTQVTSVVLGHMHDGDPGPAPTWPEPRQRHTAIIGGARFTSLMFGDDEEGRQARMEDDLNQYDCLQCDELLWPAHLRYAAPLYSGDTSMTFFTDNWSGNTAHKDPVGGYSMLVTGWKVFVWWGVMDSPAMGFDIAQPLHEQGIRPSLLQQRQREGSAPKSLRWTLLTPGDTIFIHPDVVHAVITLSSSILVTRCLTLSPLRLFRSIGYILRGRVYDVDFLVDGATASTRSGASQGFPSALEFLLRRTQLLVHRLKGLALSADVHAQSRCVALQRLAALSSHWDGQMRHTFSDWNATGSACDETGLQEQTPTRMAVHVGGWLSKAAVRRICVVWLDLASLLDSIVSTFHAFSTARENAALGSPHGVPLLAGGSFEESCCDGVR